MSLEDFKYSWYQNSSDVVVDIYQKDANSVNLAFVDSKSAVISFKVDKNGEAKGCSLSLKLWSNVERAQCHSNNSTNKRLSILFKKLDATETWAHLERQTTAATNASANSLKYPSSCKNPIDWDECERAGRQQESEEKPTGEAALQGLFQSIYKNASEDTKRAMNKSFSESGGTCLSTNWQEVGGKTVKPSPPDGCEAKKLH